ncbi:MAG: isocitrate dehydrogenase [Peptococcaceae bacterium BICA1-8]|nr:MAG: isocitrate dehydrogenase [Peptococcaceae bacterium BICA1-8]
MHNITLIPGDGIGPEVAFAVKEIIESTGVKINWDIQDAGDKTFRSSGNPLPDEVIQSVFKNKVALKGPVTTPIGTGFRSVNVALRKELGLYANLRPIKNLPGIVTPFKNVDLIVVRENTEDLYAGIERKVDAGRAEAIKLITKDASKKIGYFAFSYAQKMGRKKVTAVHKANILKISDGLFLESIREVREQFPDIEYEEMIIDNLCMQLVQRPEKFDVLVLPNFYGDIVSDLCAGLVGGLGLVPGANLGDSYAVFEAVHGSALDIAGKNMANPLALLNSAILMLNHIGEVQAAEDIERAINWILNHKERLTPDLGGKGTTTSLTRDLCEYIKENTVGAPSGRLSLIK